MILVQTPVSCTNAIADRLVSATLSLYNIAMLLYHMYLSYNIVVICFSIFIPIFDHCFICCCWNGRPSILLIYLLLTVTVCILDFIVYTHYYVLYILCFMPLLSAKCISIQWMDNSSYYYTYDQAIQNVTKCHSDWFWPPQ